MGKDWDFGNPVQQRRKGLKQQRNMARSVRWSAFALGAAAAAIVVSVLLGGGRLLVGQAPTRFQSSEAVFTPAHSGFGEAVRHFFGFEADPVQPIPFRHQLHVEEVGLDCNYCHDGVDRGPVARIPSINVCMDCHFDIATDREPIQLLTSYYDQGQEPPWQRVYGWNPEAHVRFNHAPHIRSEVECATCHGNVAAMTVAERAVDHTMRFCVRCHEQNQAPIECVTCHY